jgi:hypothetical protein
VNWAEMIFARMKRGAHLLTTVGSATQIYTPLPFVVSRHYLIAGTAVGQNYQLPDARQCEPECVITMTNASSEFVGVCPSGSTTYLVRIPPRGVATFVLVAAGTAAGTWVVTNVGPLDGAGFWSDTDHFNGSGATARWTTAASGTGALSVKLGTPHATFGNWGLRCGTTDTGYSLIRGGLTDYALSTLAPLMFEIYGAPSIVPVAGVDDFVFQAGHGSSTTDTAHSNCLVAEVSLAAAGNANWHLLATNATVETRSVGTIAMTTASQLVRVESARASSRADIWVDRVWGGTCGGLPSIAARVTGNSIRMIGVKYTANTRTYQLSRWTETVVPANQNL